MSAQTYEFEDWIGRTERTSDRLSAARSRRWLATFDRQSPDDGAMPQGIHWCLCTPEAPTIGLGEDGHPQRGNSPDSFLPPIPLPRRMWAASDVTFHAPLVPGSNVERVTRIDSIAEKEGASGRLVFVTLGHETSAGGRVAVSEKQTLVYRDAAAANAALVPPQVGEGGFDASNWQATRAVLPGEPLLFRYSALTFNSHRIHYDAPYASDVERYRGLVVHGPLTATLLLEHAAQQLGDNALANFKFRGTSPAIVGEELILGMRGTGNNIELGAVAADGRQVMTAEATVRA
ncbi:MaoC family dehydratase N-terminal domain-containing protein [Altererythrobacter sp. ZODW24]|uniref:FAS1-like dehydratase domain-containing protein n=1 Tax=Altererythrobacter sp. ZODW24 TaxID=2185142 RepID=UPI000DF83AA1|nr:MaoC family dehydratase N-terminal domain-containing protein [Altererythrobacter sp. ZODW24]